MDEYVVEFNWDSVDEFGNPWFVTRERVVRCRDCVSYRPDGPSNKPRCEKSIGTFVPSPDGFCAWGEERKA